MVNAVQELAERYLEKLYKLSEQGLKPEVDAYKLKAELGFSSEESRAVSNYLESKDLISWKCRVPCVRITTRGIDVMQNSYAEKETLVLRKIYDLSEQNTAKPVFLQQLESEMAMGWQEVTGFCKGLDEQGFVDWPPNVDSYLYITRQGIDGVQSLGKPKSPAGGDTYHLSINNMHGGVHQGPGGTQYIQVNITNDQEFDQAIQSLLQLIGSSSLPLKDELHEQVVQLNNLALQEPSPGLLEKAKFRLNMVEVGLKGTDLLIKAGPYLAIVLEYFRRKYGG